MMATPENHQTETLVELHTLLARCFERPGPELATAITSGRLDAAIRERAERLGIDLEEPPRPDEPLEAHLRTFESFEGPAAPLAESVYKEWWDGTERGILSGPPAHDMERRYEAADIEIPEGYAADHLAVILEYASLVLETDADAYPSFRANHLDWIDDLEERVAETCDVPFYRWAVTTLQAVLDRTDEHISDDPSQQRRETQ